jgi:bla regulator protein blaR1
MSPATLSAAWAGMLPRLADHLWQSTLFALAAGMLTVPLRKNHARARYWLWFATSLKFFVPFAWLIAIGNRLAWWRGAGEAGAGFYFTVEEISRPFTQPNRLSASHAASAIASPGMTNLLPFLIAGVWFCGFVVVLIAWLFRWRRISGALRESLPLREGREVEALRRQEQIAGIEKPIEILLSREMLEPGIFGIRRPVLVWPEGISQHLENEHLEAILVHELWHVRRHDNLAGVLHMTVEAGFWFYPLVWWLGARLVEERECACDEAVVELGDRRQVYAESILKVCEFCVGSPLACVSGVTGADLKKRMVHIMSGKIARKLDFSRKLMLGLAGLTAIAAPILFGLATATPSRAQSQAENAGTAVAHFESFSIKPSQNSTQAYPGGGMRMMYSPSGFAASNVTLQSLIQEAYGVEASQIAGGPDWLNSAKFDVEGTFDPSQGIKFGPGPNHTKAAALLQAALAQNTNLVLHHETRNLPTYSLTVAENGAKLRPSQSAGSNFRGTAGGPAGAHSMIRVQSAVGQAAGLSAQGVSTGDLAQLLSRRLGIPVIDKTGLQGRYDFDLHWTDGASPDVIESKTGPEGAPVSDDALLAAVQEQLGLKLDPQQQPMDVLVIDHIEKPAEN